METGRLHERAYDKILLKSIIMNSVVYVYGYFVEGQILAQVYKHIILEKVRKSEK